VTAHTIQSLIPKKYFGAFVCNQLITSCFPLTFVCVQRDQQRNNKAKQLEVEQSIVTMLEANLSSLSSTRALSNILRVVATFLLNVNFNAKSKLIKAALKKDNLPLAKLSQVALAAELAAMESVIPLISDRD